MIGAGRYVVATINGRIVGGAGWQGGLQVGTAILREVFVHPVHQNRGIGSRLVTLVEDLAVTSGYDMLTAAAPSHVVSFYRMMGYANAAGGAVALGESVDVQYREMRKAAY
jgi:GNAT superfamily N-acetyltransferase